MYIFNKTITIQELLKLATKYIDTDFVSSENGYFKSPENARRYLKKIRELAGDYLPKSWTGGV